MLRRLQELVSTRRFATSMAGVLISLPMVGSVWAGFNEGASAFNRGDYVTAFREFRSAADDGDVVAQFNLGWMFAEGKGVTKNEQQAVFWYSKAAEQGFLYAQANLGGMYADGRGVQQDFRLAEFWTRKAAEHGDAEAQELLASMYTYGHGVEMDLQKASFWYGKSAAQGNASRQLKLGEMYYSGQGVPKDVQQAAYWIRKAAEQGNATAQLNLGKLYRRGEGLPRDDPQTVFWYRAAAEQGDAEAQLLLAAMYRAGLGVSIDNEKAYFWSLLAAARGEELAYAVRDELEAMLSPTQRAAAQVEARSWTAKQGAVAVTFAPDETHIPSAKFEPAPKAEEATLSSMGSGFFVSRERVITNNHVTAGCTRLYIGDQLEGYLLATDRRSDLSLIAVKREKHDTAMLRVGRINIGEAAMVAGFPLPTVLAGFNVTTGNVSSLAGIGGDSRLLQISAPVQPGNSGGPLLDAGGKVIGVVVSKLDTLKFAESTGDVPQNVNFAINGNVLASFLDANGVDYKSGPVGPVMPTQEVARRAQAFTVQIECWK